MYACVYTFMYSEYLVVVALEFILLSHAHVRAGSTCVHVYIRIHKASTHSVPAEIHVQPVCIETWRTHMHTIHVTYTVPRNKTQNKNIAKKVPGLIVGKTTVEMTLSIHTSAGPCLFETGVTVLCGFCFVACLCMSATHV